MGRFRRWIIKLFFGDDMINYINATIQMTDLLSHHIADIRQHQVEMAKILALLSEHGPQEGWVPMVTNAVIGLDRRADAIAAILAQHERNFEKIFSVKDGVEIIDLVKTERPD